ncbi:MAG: helix-turn-helix domain-containing protein [Planctomycetaceae bacterium]|nr:helix-turn-helix domain-containing protein [Planctomycetaceae bacterium]
MRLLTIDEAAERLSITPRQVNTLIRSGRLPWVNVSLKAGSSKPRKRIAESDLFRFIEQRRVTQQAVAPRKYRRHVRQSQA